MRIPGRDPGRRRRREFDHRQDATDEGSHGPPSALEAEHPALYGRLLACEERLQETGVGTFFLVIILGIAASAALALGWIESLTGRSTDVFESWWVYVILVLLAIVAAIKITDLLERGAYRRFRPDILEAISRSGIDGYSLIARIERESGLRNVAQQLKRDPDLERDVRH